MDSKIGFEMSLFVVEAFKNTWTMCEFHDSNGNGLGDIWWTDKFILVRNSVSRNGSVRDHELG